MMSFYMEFITAVSCYGANVGGVLLLKDAICKCIFGVIVVDRHSDLRDDRAVVKAGAHEVDCAACDFYARFDRLTLGMKPAEAREKRRMDIDDAVRECVHKLFPADTHISREADEVWRIGLGSRQNGCIEVRLVSEVFAFENRRRYIPALGTFKDLGIGMVADHADHSAVNGTIDRRFMDGFCIRSPAGSENQNFLTHGKDHLSQ